MKILEYISTFSRQQQTGIVLSSYKVNSVKYIFVWERRQLQVHVSVEEATLNHVVKETNIEGAIYTTAHCILILRKK